MPSSVDSLIDRLITDPKLVAIVSSQKLKPLIGDTVYPASYAASDSGDSKGPRYCITELRDGRNICVIDSIPSQANRIEAEFLTQQYQSIIPDVRIKAKLIDEKVEERHMLELGHRATDGAVLASTLEPEITSALKEVHQDPTKLAKLAPMCLLMGVWDSRKNRTGLKLPRAFSATIEATDVSERRRHAQYNSAWNANELSAELQKEAGSKPSEIGLDGVPSGDNLGGVFVQGDITRNAFLATNPLRANCASTNNAGAEATRYVAALGLLALTMPMPSWLRTGCNLIPTGDALIETVTTDGKREQISLAHEEVLSVAKQLSASLGIAKQSPKVGEITAANVKKLASAKDDSSKKTKGSKSQAEPSESAAVEP